PNRVGHKAFKTASGNNHTIMIAVIAGAATSVPNPTGITLPKSIVPKASAAVCQSQLETANMRSRRKSAAPPAVKPAAFAVPALPVCCVGAESSEEGSDTALIMARNQVQGRPKHAAKRCNRKEIA